MEEINLVLLKLGLRSIYIKHYCFVWKLCMEKKRKEEENNFLLFGLRGNKKENNKTKNNNFLSSIPTFLYFPLVSFPFGPI